MTCKDCYHHDVCHLRISLNMDYDEVKNIPITEMEKQCEYYKDKSRIIELPCKVGEEIYVMNRANIPQRMILDKPDIRCHCAKEDDLCMALCDDKKHGICAYRFNNDGSDIGEKVFLTKEEAEAN